MGSQLPARWFARVHRAAIVHFGHIRLIERGANDLLRIHVDGVTEPVPVSRRRAAALRRDGR